LFLFIFLIYQNKYKLFGSAPYPGRSSLTKPSCSKTELNRCTIATEIRWNKTGGGRTSRRRLHQSPAAQLWDNPCRYCYCCCLDYFRLEV